MQTLKGIFYLFAVSVILASCDNTPTHPDTLSSGSIDISADETYKPVIEEQLKVFDSSYPNAHITVHYKPESECFKDFFDNKARLILVTRQLSSAEKQLCDQKQIAPSSLPLAKDAVAVIVNNSSSDSLLDMQALKGILTGIYKKKYTVVFDNQGSSTVRYITDSLLKGAKLGSNVFAAKGNEAVVDYVAKNPGAIGFVGLSYVSDPVDSANTGGFINTIKVVSILNDSTQRFYQPYQAYIALKWYPLTRDLFYISRESYHGLGTGFANFLANERGQLIFKHADMFPLRMNIIIRDASVNP
ncbi:MAG: PstS family phosphate ABC transporter substrate-binding protein [Flavipsychrobacter sp.]